MSWWRRNHAYEDHVAEPDMTAVFVMPQDPAEVDLLAERLRAEGYASGSTALVASPETLDWLGVQLAKRGYDPEAETAFLASAASGYPIGAYNYALMCDRAGRTGEAMRAYRLAAQGRHPAAANRLGAALLDTGDIEEALDWFQRAAEAGDPDASENVALAQHYLSARAAGADPESRNEDLDPEVAYRLGILAERAGKDERAEQWYRQASAAGHTVAALNVAMAIDRRGDELGAMPWYERAAEAGSSEAMFNLALCELNQDHAARAEHWYRRAADAGHAKAMTNLATLLLDRGHHEEARGWYERAEAAGDDVAGQALHAHFGADFDPPRV
jgi:eukaryotic-like serine/threonine-protein kinase